MVHRGAAAFAPENTLEAFAAAMDHGADGCEVDVRRTLDGVLVLFHDDMLDHLTDGIGVIEQATYYNLLSLRPRFQYGRATPRTRLPTFAALLTLARRRAMLLHLDVKQTGLDAELAAMLESAGAWEHVVAINRETAPSLARDPRFAPLAYKGPGLYDQRRDLDPEAVRAQLARPGQMIMVDDPRVAALVLKRSPQTAADPPAELRQLWPRRSSRPGGARRSLQEWPVFFGSRFDSPPPGRFRFKLWAYPAGFSAAPVSEAEAERRRTHQIVARAVAAQRIGASGALSGSRIQELIGWVTHRSLHRDWMFHALDGASAARVLGEKGAVAAAPALIAALRRVDPELRTVQDPRFSANPLAWTDFRLKMYALPALARLVCPEARAFLKEYLALPEARAREWAPLLYEDATRALLAQQLDRAEVEALLHSANPAVRGTAILECLDHPTAVRSAALRNAASWAAELSRADGVAAETR
jgi:hypothetical protein